MTDNQIRAQQFFRTDVDAYKKEHYDSRYRTHMSVRQDRFLEEIERLNLPVQSNALDAGCGPGYLSNALRDRGFSVHAIDTSEEMLKLTAAFGSTDGGGQGPVLAKGSVESLPYEDGSFDLVASAGVIEYLADDAPVLGEFRRVLRVGGYMVLSTTNKLSPLGYLEFVIEPVKRSDKLRGLCNRILERANRTPVRPREFHVRRHVPSALRRSVAQAGFELVRDGFFYILPWPHPFDRVFPEASSKLGERLEFISRGPLRGVSDGYYVVARK